MDRDQLKWARLAHSKSRSLRPSWDISAGCKRLFTVVQPKGARVAAWDAVSRLASCYAVTCCYMRQVLCLLLLASTLTLPYSSRGVDNSTRLFELAGTPFVAALLKELGPDFNALLVTDLGKGAVLLGIDLGASFMAEVRRFLCVCQEQPAGLLVTSVCCCAAGAAAT